MEQDQRTGQYSIYLFNYLLDTSCTQSTVSKEYELHGKVHKTLTTARYNNIIKLSCLTTRNEICNV